MRKTYGRWLLIAALSGTSLVTGCDTAGPEGPKGLDGTPGTPGADGTPGTDGTDGASGADGASGTDGRDGVHSMYFTPVDVPTTDATKRDILASQSALVDGNEVSLGYRRLYRVGDTIGTGRYGVVVDQNGAAIKDAMGADLLTDSSDFTSILPVGDRVYQVSHLETTPGGMYVTELLQDSGGNLSPVSTRPVDFKSVGGLWIPCAGSVTPWFSHLGSEEYPPDARSFATSATLADFPSYAASDKSSMIAFVRYFGVTGWTDATPTSTVLSTFNPYAYGFATEVRVGTGGTTSVAKHYAMGRMALELANVMPDRRTVYLTDDGTNVGLFMFVAKTAGNLDEGSLYAVKWNQTSSVDGGSADLEWIPLGPSATSAEVKALIDANTKFTDIFDIGDKAACPSDFKLIAAGDAGVECLRIKPGMELAASRLETRRYAAYVGATTEFRKEEGSTFDERTKTLYVAFSAIEKGMEDNKGGDVAGANHIRLPKNACGGVYALTVGTDWTIQSEYVAREAHAVVVGTPTTYAATSPFTGNTCDVDGIASPDNVSILPGYDVLIIGEDTDKHQNDVIWSYDLRDHELTRIQTTPYGAETTSPYWYRNLHGHGYLMSVVQHPYGESDQAMLAGGPASAARAYVGYIGPFPRLD